MARVMWHPVQGLGFGLYGFGNFNTLPSFGGLALMLSFGKVRSRSLRDRMRTGPDRHRCYNRWGISAFRSVG